MRIAVFGTGGVGGYFGALLAQAGHALTVVARGAHLAAIQARGLQIRSGHGDFHVQPAAVTPGTPVACDLAIVAVKNYDLVPALDDIAAVAGGDTPVLSLLNGIDAARDLGARFGAERILVGQCQVGAWVSAPGEVTHIGVRRGIALGEWSGAPRERTRSMAEHLGHAGITIELVDDVPRAVWSKLIWTASYSGVAALARAGAGEVRSAPELRAMVEQALHEGAAVARASGVALPDDVVAGALQTLDSLAPGARPSLLRDLEQNRRLETEALSGAIVRTGREVGVATPVHDVLHALLSFVDQRVRGRVIG